MRRQTKLIAAAILCASFSANAAAPAYITAAVADASRPDKDKQRDADRKPADVLAFAGVKPGDKVGELIPGGGYFTKILCKVVGDKGHVYAMGIRPVPRPDRPAPANPPAAPAPGPNDCTNVTPDSKPAAEFALPAGLDVVWTSENYHDFHNPGFGVTDMLQFNKVIFNALKPGGIYIVEDHAAETGSGVRDTGTLHRIDPDQVKKEVTAAGFVFEGASDLLKNSADPHTAGVRELPGKTDKFLFKFRKPAR